VHLNSQEAAVDRPFDHAFPERSPQRRADPVRENCDDVESHVSSLPSVQVEQSFGRLDHDAPAARIDLNTDIGGKGHQYLAVPLPNHKVAATAWALNGCDSAQIQPRGRPHPATDQIMTIEFAGRELLKRVSRHSELGARQPLGLFDRPNVFERQNRAALMKTNRAHGQRSRNTGLPGIQHRARAKSLLQEVRFGIDDDLTADAVRPSDTPDDHHGVPLRHVSSPASRRVLRG